eukprot:4818409-Prymnesium_polylepis.1
MRWAWGGSEQTAAKEYTAARESRESQESLEQKVSVDRVEPISTGVEEGKHSTCRSDHSTCRSDTQSFRLSQCVGADAASSNGHSTRRVSVPVIDAGDDITKEAPADAPAAQTASTTPAANAPSTECSEPRSAGAPSVEEPTVLNNGKAVPQEALASSLKRAGSARASSKRLSTFMNQRLSLITAALRIQRVVRRRREQSPMEAAGDSVKRGSQASRIMSAIRNSVRNSVVRSRRDDMGGECGNCDSARQRDGEPGSTQPPTANGASKKARTPGSKPTR